MSELGPDARAILDGGRDGDDPTGADRARIRASVMRAIAAGGAIGAAAAAGEAAAGAAPAAGLSLVWKIVGGAVLATVVVGGAILGADRMSARPPPAPAIPAVSAAAPPGEPAVAITAAPTAPVESPPSVASAARSAAPRATALPIARPSAEPAAIEPAAPIASAIASAPPDTLAAETQRLREAHGAMKGGDPNKALSLLDEQGAAGAELREERAAARVLALCQLGRKEEARAAAARFLAESPRSPLADRVRGACVDP